MLGADLVVSFVREGSGGEEEVEVEEEENSLRVDRLLLFFFIVDAECERQKTSSWGNALRAPCARSPPSPPRSIIEGKSALDAGAGGTRYR